MPEYYIPKKEDQEYYAHKWAKHHNATVISTGAYGFVYMLDNGQTYSISWWEI